jgi:hypothetical protein
MLLQPGRLALLPCAPKHLVEIQLTFAKYKGLSGLALMEDWIVYLFVS